MTGDNWVRHIQGNRGIIKSVLKANGVHGGGLSHTFDLSRKAVHSDATEATGNIGQLLEGQRGGQEGERAVQAQRVASNGTSRLGKALEKAYPEHVSRILQPSLKQVAQAPPVLQPSREEREESCQI